MRSGFRAGARPGRWRHEEGQLAPFLGRGTNLVETTCGSEKTLDRILVAYGSKHGATAEIADRIGQVLCQAGLPTAVRPADRVGDLTPCRAVVLGSAVYYGRWHKQAATFLKAKEGALAARPVWLFSSGPTGEGDPVTLLKGWRFPKDLQPIADRIRPRDVAVFCANACTSSVNGDSCWPHPDDLSPVQPREPGKRITHRSSRSKVDRNGRRVSP